jgi:RNA polymerase primary sigma factor
MATKKQKQEPTPEEQTRETTAPDAAAAEAVAPTPASGAAALPGAPLEEIEEPSAQELQQVASEDEDEEYDVDELHEMVAATDAITRYLREIGRTPLLNAQEEVDLAQAIEHGKLARTQIGELNGDLDPAARFELIQLKERGDEARQKLIQANLRLVVSVAKKYMGRGMPLLDLIQEGNIGLMRAVEKFDWRKGNRFSTYATWWIRQAVTRALAEQSRLIRLPVHLGESLGQMRRTAERLAIALQREPTHAELGTALGLPEEQIKRMLEAVRQPISLSTPVGESGESQFGDFIEDDRIAPPEEQASRTMLERDIFKALSELPDRERTVLELRYGLNDGQRRTLEEVGRSLGITRERARQIEGEALRRLRVSQMGAGLRGYLE